MVCKFSSSLLLFVDVEGVVMQLQQCVPEKRCNGVTDNQSCEIAFRAGAIMEINDITFQAARVAETR